VRDLADQRAALFGKHHRRTLKLRALRLDLGDAGIDGRELRGGACLAVLPIVALGDDRLHAAVGEFGLARERLRLGAHLRREPALALDLGTNRGEPGFGLGAWRQVGKRLGRALMRTIDLGAVDGKAAIGFR